jgi:hypothetical protein
MFALILAWLGTGMLSGLLVCLACLRSYRWWSWFTLPGLGSVAALCGGGLGMVLLGRYFSFGTALWFAILVTTFVWNMARMTAWVKGFLSSYNACFTSSIWRK